MKQWAVAAGFAAMFLAYACGSDGDGPMGPTDPAPGPAGHTLRLGAIPHASNPCTPQADCASCHGSDLRGGGNGEPSCFACHNDRWNAGSCR